MRDFSFLIVSTFVQLLVSSNSYSVQPQQPSTPPFYLADFVKPSKPAVLDDNCVNTCRSSEGAEPTILKYKQNEVIRYKIEALTSIHLPNSLKGESTKLTYNGGFEISAENECSFVLKVTNVEIVGPDGKKHADNALVGRPARFSWGSGKLETLCLDKEESEAAANFKRSIITNLQISSWGNPVTRAIPTDGSSIYETDIYGRCPANVEAVQEQDGSWTISKTKDINRCLHRQGFDFAMKTGFYQSDNSQTNPFVQASLRSSIRVEKNIVRFVEVNEEYLYQPLSNYADSQTSVLVTTKITYSGRSKNGLTLDSFNPVPKTLLFETVKSNQEEATISTLIKAIQDASQEEDGVIPSNGATKFNELVSVMQQAKASDILTVHSQVNSGAGFKYKKTAETVFWDGLISAATAATTEAAATLLIDGKMPDNKVNSFLASLSFVKHPTEETLKTLVTLVQGSRIPFERYLALGAITRRYISDHPNADSPALKELLEKLSAPIKKGCLCRTIEEEDLVIASLKGLRNAYYVTAEIADLVRSCATNANVTSRARVAALQTMMANSSDSLNQEAALNLFKTTNEDAELRIMAFLVYVNSPSAESADMVKTLLDAEHSDQVGSYILSYLRNLKTTSDPQKAKLKYYYGNIQTKNKYPVDFRQYSQNYHVSHQCSAMNFGFSADGDVIFSPQTYLPRSTTVGLNSHVFGNSFNLFELSTRLENVEYMIEKFAGPRSYVRTNDLEDIADDLTNAAQRLSGEMLEKATLLGRSRRAMDDVAALPSKVVKKKTPLSDMYVDLDLSMKMFESEMFWWTYHTDKNMVANGEFLEALYKRIEAAIQGAKNMDIDYKRFARSPILSNSHIYYPTSAGLQLKASTNADSVVQFKMNGQVDVMKILKKPGSADVQVMMMPSAVVQIDGALEIDGSIISTGLKVSSSLRSSTGLELSLRVLDGQGYDIKIGVPLKEQDLFTMKTEAFATMQTRGLPPMEVPLKPGGKRYDYSGSFQQLADLTGMALYAEMSSPALSLKPTLGPSKFSLRLLKTDESLQYYQMKLLLNNKNPGYRSFEFLMDTPGSNINRKISFFGDINSKEKKITAKFISPKREIEIEAYGVAKNDEISCNMKFISDRSEYAMKLGATVTNEKYRTTYKPFLHLKSPYDHTETSLNQVRVNPKQPSQMFNIDGLIVKETKKNSNSYRKYEFQQLTLTTPFGNFVLQGPVQIDSAIPQFGSGLVLTYGNSNTITLRSDVNYTKNLPQEKQLTANVAVMPSQWPTHGFNFNLNYNENPNAYDRVISLTHGPDMNSKLSTITIREIFNEERAPQSNKFLSADYKLQASYPLWRFDFNTALKKQKNNFYSTTNSLVLDKTNLYVDGSLGLGNRMPGNIDFQLQTKMNERSLNLNAFRELINDETSKITIQANTFPGKEINAIIDLTHRFRPQNYVFKFDSTVTVLPDNKIYKQDIGFIFTPEEKGVHLMITPNDERNMEIRAVYKKSPSGTNSNAVLYLINTVDGTASLEIKPTKIKGDLKLNIVKLNRLITGKLNLSVTDGTKYKGGAELLWDASKDTSKKLRIRTNTEFSNDNRNVSTSNTIQIVNVLYQINANLGLEGELGNGTVTGDMEIILQNETRIGTKIRQTYRPDNALHNYDLNVDGYYTPGQTQEPTAVNFKLAARDIDLSNYLFDVDTGFTLGSESLKNFSTGVQAKRTLSDGKWSVGGEFYMDGANMRKKLNLSVALEYSDLVRDFGLLTKNKSVPPTTYRLYGSLGDEYVIDNTGKIGNAQINNVMQLKIPSQRNPLSLKWTTDSKIDIAASKYINIRTANAAVWNENKYANWNGKFEVYPKNGKMSLLWESSDVSKRSLDFSYAYDDTQDEGLLGPYAQAGVNLTLNGKAANCQMKVEFSKDLSSKQVTITGDSPNSGKFDVRVTNKIEDQGHRFFSDLNITTSKNRWYASSLIETYPGKPSIDVLYSTPEGDSKLVMKFEERMRHYWSGMADVSWMHGSRGYITADGELKLNSADDIHVKFNLDSPTLGVNNFSLNANNQATENGRKRIAFTTKLANNPQYSGSASYLYSSDDTKLAFESSGSIKIEDKSHPFTFKFHRSQISEGTHGETGSSNELYLSVDNKKYALLLEGKFTDSGVLLKRKLWRDNKPYEIDLSYETKMTDVMNYEKIILIHIDLEPYIKGGEKFVIEGRTTRSVSNYDHRLSLQWAPEKKVEYNFYSTSGKSGVIFTLPTRQLAAEADYSYKLDTTNGNVKITGTIWFDKNRDDNQKLLVSAGTQYKIPENKNIFVMKSTFSTQIPTLPKTLTIANTLFVSPFEDKAVDFKSELDLFKKEDQMIILTYQLFKKKIDGGYMVTSVLKGISAGQNMNAELRRSLSMFLDHFEYRLIYTYTDYNEEKKVSSFDLDLYLTTFRSKLQIFDKIHLSGKGDLSFGKKYIQYKYDYNVFGHQYAQTWRISTDLGLGFIYEWKGDVKQAVVVSTSLKFRQELEINAVLVGRGNISTFTLYLDDDRFMKTKTELNLDNFKIFMDNGKVDLIRLMNDSKMNTKSAINDISNQLSYRTRQFRSASFDVKPMLESANQYLTTLRDEIKNDPSIASASHNVKILVNGVADFVFVILQQISSFMGDWINGYNLLLEKLNELIEGFVENINKLSQLTLDDMMLWLQEMLTQLWKSSLKLIEYVNNNKDKWREAVMSLSESVKDAYKIIIDTFEQFRRDANELYNRLQVYLSSLPITNYLKDKFEQLKNSQILQALWSNFRERMENMKEYMPTPEMKILMSTILDTLDKLIANPQYDASEDLKTIFSQFIESIRSLYKLATSQAYMKDVMDYDYNMPQLSLASLKQIPNMLSSSINYVNRIREYDMPSFDDYIQTYKLGSLNLLDIIPPYKKVAMIMNGQIITMNGIYYTLNADCQYLLAGDFENANFTVTAGLKKERLTTLAISSSSETIVLTADGVPMLENVRTEFPIYADGLYATRTAYSIQVYVDNSVFVMCTPRIEICTVQVSGFYQNMVYGLLGSPNAEAAVDLTMADMTITDDLTTFIKSYQVGSKCKEPMPTPLGQVQRSSECNDMFSGKSVLRRGFSHMRMKPYRDMCDHMVSTRSTPAERLDAACQTGLAFSLVSLMNGYYVTLPSHCFKCAVNGKSLAYDVSENVMIPSTSADILLVLDASTNSEPVYKDLMAKSMTAMKNNLAEKGISDVQYSMVAYGPGIAEPSLHTTNGATVLNENSNVKFSTVSKPEPTTKLGRFVRNAKGFLGIYDARAALRIANEFPFRPEAVKSIVHIDSSADDYSYMDKYKIYSSLTNAMVSWNIINNRIPMFLVTSKHVREVDSDSSVADLFGFDLNYMYTVSGPKPFENGILNRMSLLEAYGGSSVIPLSTDGAVFNSSKFTSSSSDIRSKLTNVFTNRLVDSLTSTERQLECTCKSKWGIYPEPRCTLISSSPRS